jgi:hypothetical protein
MNLLKEQNGRPLFPLHRRIVIGTVPLTLLKICKKYHPDKPVIFGGLSSS